MQSHRITQKSGRSGGFNAAKQDIIAPVVKASGAIIVHRALEQHVAGYQVEALSPYWGLCPPLLSMRGRTSCAITHSTPELGPWHVHPDSDLVATFHGYYLDEEFINGSSWSRRIFYRYILSAAIKAALKRARYITAVSKFTADLVRQHHDVQNRLVLIPNGVDASLFKPAQKIHADTINILFAGNPTRNKGAGHLAALSQELPEGVVLQYTSGMRKSSVIDPGRSQKLVSMPPRNHEDMPKLYQQADILFFPTRREGMSLVVLEAMACGLPVVASRCASLPELVDHGKGGFLFEMDNRRQMLGFLSQLIRDSSMRAEMGAYNREKILADYTLQKTVHGYKQVFTACNKGHN
ncbi:MAG: glycosyltransferase family 4 protein [Gammaproteobacteria bacterium]|nr:glycosyltransferase family 4 protein [Gammaproteobacteria bacterium]